MKVRAMATFSTQGKREVQEDHTLLNQDKGVFVVADGFGGTTNYQPAKIACEAVKEFLETEAGDREATLPFVLRHYFTLAGNIAFNSILYANQKILQLNEKKGIYDKGGSSVLAAYLDDSLLALANVGVCSAWLLRENETRELVTPRSYGLQETPFEQVPEDQKIPLTALGIHEDLEPEIFEFRVRAGDWLILNTDGFGQQVFDIIKDIRFQGYGAEDSCRAMRAPLEELAPSDNSSISLIIL